MASVLLTRANTASNVWLP